MDNDIRTLQRKDDTTSRQRLANAGIRAGLTFSQTFGFDTEDVDDRETTSDEPRIVIDGERYHVTNSRQIGYGDTWEIDTEEGESFIVSEDDDTAGAAARDRWEDMAKNDPSEFACMVGEETLVAWALGQYASPGSTPVSSLTEWLDLVATVPSEEWAGYDGQERTVDRVGKLASELGYVPTVAYRCN
jgi:hypothetical protein